MSTQWSGRLEDRVEKVRRVIQDFGKLIVDDPFHVKKSWSGRDPCKYRGFTCDNLPDLQGQNAVAGVDFNGFKFAGKDGKLSLKRFIDRLPDLAFFHANSNNFTEVPIIGTDKIRFLYELDLSNSKLTGEFPYQVLSAINLTFLDLRFNQFYGRVPREVFNLDVQVIFINNNYFDQSLPDNLGSTPALYLTFANNRFTGQIPSSIGRARNLLEVLFLKNQFSGCLPYEIGFLNKLTLFDASHNHITGPIPHSFGCLAKIELLNLANNELYGAVPESVCKLRNLGNLSLAGNYFTQVGTECRKLINKKYLDLNKNCILDLPNQRSKYECARFFSEPRRCPNEKYLTYIPCKNQWYHSASETDQESSAFITGEKIAPAPSTPVTYAALTPRGL
ncbi:LRR domain containing protein [Parasponia andersonii]|uniref:LRR domain containing protein n=1 Tax=Parasponia andersonii TaxID=3476 RepID=A0A2P5AW88_PARAD|nr:LRR domain containing protein [Parasponia andersonii]